MLHTNDLFKLEGKVALITGGASGIGFATAKRLAEFGANVMLLDINEELGETAARRIQDLGGAARFFKCNVVSQEECRQVTEAIEEAYGRIDILFNNAGVIRRKTVVELEEQDWDLVINVSLKGAYNLSKYVIPIMTKSGGGSIINTGSGWGIKGGDKAAAYCAAKAGVVNLTRAMAIDHGPENIRVNCVSPGDTDTPLLREEARQLNKEESAFLVSSAQGRPLERLGTPQDIANAVLFFASDLSAWVTGSVLVVDGGGLA
ncbi:3-oxoacyl-[acyl-carrier-protein] reductase FabG [Brevibacillus reuszeri]|uniref:3-oxoacyl-[acyl-carrier-protein] reductase FabG n=1 Tax=Brevibacillus reuszeri TaxID=54915 RepID=A0A0K9YTK9_9BACL|nr:SDR family NAD(P)-dependent oxidoreductase [Brevibacillus reuszeri]KNB71535.1 short-chain dehydrogenase [Brevibacillus reuszeri]MED1855658.1 SDR family NAD(P)-dependent oxidoreductase [Brevibacillus reuszeri]GED67192.1 3-oxoacyl-[acyl-carrier-protein] reductase FabG [Brevibacillus reuszeri]